jgi:hypothetical protein
LPPHLEYSSSLKPQRPFGKRPDAVERYLRRLPQHNRGRQRRSFYLPLSLHVFELPGIRGESVGTNAARAFDRRQRAAGTLCVSSAEAPGSVERSKRSGTSLRLPQLRKPSLAWLLSLLSVASCRQPGTGVQARLHVHTACSRWPALGCLALGVRLFLGRIFRLGRLSGRGEVSRFIGGLLRRRSVDHRQLRHRVGVARRRVNGNC